jgi:hypothetical protein
MLCISCFGGCTSQKWKGKRGLLIGWSHFEAGRSTICSFANHPIVQCALFASSWLRGSKAHKVANSTKLRLSQLTPESTVLYLCLCVITRTAPVMRVVCCSSLPFSLSWDFLVLRPSPSQRSHVVVIALKLYSYCISPLPSHKPQICA